MAEKPRIIVMMQGGVCVGAHATLPIDVEVLDYDDLEQLRGMDEPKTSRGEKDQLFKLEQLEGEVEHSNNGEPKGEGELRPVY